jgi:hypothetical protein
MGWRPLRGRLPSNGPPGADIAPGAPGRFEVTVPDFARLRTQHTTARSPHPRDIFNRLVKPSYIRDLLPGQIEVLEAWWTQRDQQDTILKQNTGSGKTLVGILVAESTMVEKGGRVLYLCPNKQLVEQTIEKALELGITAEPYVSGQKLPPRFLAGKAMLVASYQALFNGRSRFGVRGTEYVDVSALILDDAHVEIAALRDAFTLDIRGDAESTKEVYERLVTILRPAFEDTGHGMTFDAIVEGKEWTVLELPYWKWDELWQQVADVIRDTNELAWPLIRDDLRSCHCLVGRHSVSIVPSLPPVDLLPTFRNASRRIFMSATLTDDSVLAATFGISHDVVNRSISTTSLASVGERMILIPGFRHDLDEATVRANVTALVKEVAGRGLGVAILTPSKPDAREWKDVGRVLDTSEKVAEAVSTMQDGSDRTPVVLANRYDGIDLAGDACRLLVMDGKPQGRSVYEEYRGTILIDSGEIASSMAQRVEQGLGRGSRGGGDYCAVLVLGDSLVEWISRSDNWGYMTASTRAQIGIGEQTSQSLAGIADLIASVWQCIDRDANWVSYHQEQLVDRIEAEKPPAPSDSPMLIERRAYERARLGEFAVAATMLMSAVDDDVTVLPRDYKAWFLQNAARYAWLAGDRPRAIDLQKRAFGINKSLFKPPIAEDPYISASAPEYDQASMVLRKVDQYHRPAAYVQHVQGLLRPLVAPQATYARFELALKDMGDILGFYSERPDSGRRPRTGPDVLWLADNLEAFVIEAKNEKDEAGHFHRDEHGQLLQACVWFTTHYPDWTYNAVVALPEAKATQSVDIGTTRALDTRAIASLHDDTLAAFREIVALQRGARSQAETRLILDRYRLTPARIRERLIVFEQVADRRGEAVAMDLGH